MENAGPIGEQLRDFRTRCGMSIRALSAKSGVAAGMISGIERDKHSPSIATLQKILVALGSDLGAFLSGPDTPQNGPVYPRENMQLVRGAERTYTLVFPRRDDVAVQMLDEQVRPATDKPPMESPRCDVAGYVINGDLVLEVQGRPAEALRAGDAFYVPRGTAHRGYPAGDEPVRLITVCNPPRY